MADPSEGSTPKTAVLHHHNLKQRHRQHHPPSTPPPLILLHNSCADGGVPPPPAPVSPLQHSPGSCFGSRNPTGIRRERIQSETAPPERGGGGWRGRSYPTRQLTGTGACAGAHPDVSPPATYRQIRVYNYGKQLFSIGNPQTRFQWKQRLRVANPAGGSC